MINQQSKTLNFDKNLNEILANLKPHQRTCQQCGEVFNIFQEDIEFYKKLQVPPPKLCPLCRMQRRWGWNNYFILHKRKCDAPGHKEHIISSFSPESPYKIYDFKYWWSDEWGADNYSREYNLQERFFEQFNRLNLDVPHTDNKSLANINSEYSLGGVQLKNCYYNFGGLTAENLFYCVNCMYSKDSMDCLRALRSELCYETIDSHKCYQCHFCERCRECQNSLFLYECFNCSNCFLCYNLRNKSYCFLNQQLTKEEYKHKLNQINLGNRDTLIKYKKIFLQLIQEKALHRNLRNLRVINSLGDLLIECNNCFYGFNTEKGENLRYTSLAPNTKDTMDVFRVVGEQFYESTIVLGAKIKFSFLCRNDVDLEYCVECHDCQHCFGCVGLRNKSYCILNKQYNPSDYYQLLDKIKTKTLKDEEYGEFFPLSMSLHPYNDTYAMIEFPLIEEDVLKNGWQWYETPKIPPDLMRIEVIEAKNLPKDIKEVKDDILNKAIICEVTGKPFRIIKSELDFYRKMNLPLPTKHPSQRILERFREINPSRLWKATCFKCQKDMFTSYSPKKQRELKIYCEDCYLREVI